MIFSLSQIPLLKFAFCPALKGIQLKSVYLFILFIFLFIYFFLFIYLFFFFLLFLKLSTWDSDWKTTLI